MTMQAKAIDGDIEVVVLKPDDAEFNRVHVHPRTAFAPQASLVFQLAAACAGPQTDGAGARLLTPEEVVARAFAIADGVFAEFDRRGWSAALPSLEELRKPGGGVGFVAAARG